MIKWLIDLLGSFFGIFLDRTIEEIKKPDEGHFIGGDEDLIDDVNANIEAQLIGDDTTRIGRQKIDERDKPRGVGTKVDDFLKDEGIYDEVNGAARRRAKDMDHG